MFCVCCERLRNLPAVLWFHDFVIIRTFILAISVNKDIAVELISKMF